MFGVFVNMAAIICGAIIGTFAGKRFPEKVSKACMDSIALFTLYVGIKGTLVGEKSIISILSLVFGTIIGTIIDIDKYIVIFGEFLKKKFASNDENKRFVEAFVNASILYGVGAMAILGSIEAGIKKEYSIFYLKSVMDALSALVFSTTMGIGVAFSAITIFILQGSMTLLAVFIKPIAENPAIMNEISCVGSLLIIAISLNILGIVKIKVVNLLPAIIFVPILFAIHVF